MTIHRIGAALALLMAANVGQAHEPASSLPPVQAVQFVFDCQAPRRLPTQAQVGEWTGQHNLSQVYATRERLMGDVARACLQPGIEQVHLVLQPVQPAATRNVRWIASIQPAAN